MKKVVKQLLLVTVIFTLLVTQAFAAPNNNTGTLSTNKTLASFPPQCLL